MWIAQPIVPKKYLVILRIRNQVTWAASKAEP